MHRIIVNTEVIRQEAIFPKNIDVIILTISVMACCRQNFVNNLANSKVNSVTLVLCTKKSQLVNIQANIIQEEYAILMFVRFVCDKKW